MHQEWLWAEIPHMSDMRKSVFSPEISLYAEIKSGPYRGTGFPTLARACERLSKGLPNEAHQSESDDGTDGGHDPSVLTAEGAPPQKPSKEVSPRPRSGASQRPPHLLQAWVFPALGLGGHGTGLFHIL